MCHWKVVVLVVVLQYGSLVAVVLLFCCCFARLQEWCCQFVHLQLAVRDCFFVCLKAEKVSCAPGFH